MTSSARLLYRSQLVYSVFVRQHTPEGTLRALEGDLDRIRALGTDILWLMPVYPIGEKARKGTLGSPYAIRDYRAVDPALGTLEDLRHLADEVHARGMKLVMDIVFNHTSPDALYLTSHPEWYFRRGGRTGNRVGDWYDIIDLDYTDRALWREQIGVLTFWAQIADGFRCDVAPLVPLAFWEEAREKVERVRPGCFWLAETVEGDFARSLREQGIPCAGDVEMYSAFDAEYDYDTRPVFEAAVRGDAPLADYARALMAQEEEYPGDYVKLRFLENHDRPRAAELIPDARRRRNWTAFLYFARGLTLLYGGQEFSCRHRPDLFEKDTVDRKEGEDITPFLRALLKVRRLPILRDGAFSVRAEGNDLLLASYTLGGQTLRGVFFVGEGASTAPRLPVGTENLIGAAEPGEPLIYWEREGH